MFNWLKSKKENKEEARAKLKNVRCYDCDYVGGVSGDTCSECNGMLLSDSARNEAKLLAEVWILRDFIKREMPCYCDEDNSCRYCEAIRMNIGELYES